MPRLHTDWWLKKKGMLPKPRKRFQPVKTKPPKKAKPKPIKVFPVKLKPPKFKPFKFPKIKPKPLPSTKKPEPVVTLPKRKVSLVTRRKMREKMREGRSIIQRAMRKGSPLKYIHLSHLYRYAKKHGIDFEAHIDPKLEYDEQKRLFAKMRPPGSTTEKFEDYGNAAVKEERKWLQLHSHFIKGVKL